MTSGMGGGVGYNFVRHTSHDGFPQQRSLIYSCIFMTSHVMASKIDWHGHKAEPNTSLGGL